MSGGRPDTVVLAVDDSRYSKEAVEWYFDHMHRKENKVIIVHCMEMPVIPSRDTWEEQTKVGREKGKSVETKFKEMLQKYDVEPMFLLECEKPGEYIVEIANKEGADVICMGTRGVSRLRRVFLGSVSNYVLNHAHCPVLVVRPHDDHENNDHHHHEH